MGGDEYAAVLVMNLTEEEVALRVQAMEKYLEDVNQTAGKPFRVTISYGISREDPMQVDQNHLLHRADQLMYASKRSYKEKRKKGV